MIVGRDLLETAVAMRALSPELWDRFMAGLRAHVSSTTAEMMRCDPQLLLRAQGMAQGLQDLVQQLASAPDQLEKLRTKAYGKETHSNNDRRA